MATLYDAITKQDTLVDLVRNYYTNDIASQADSGDNVIFTVGSHHFVEDDTVLIEGVVDGSGDAIAVYNNSFTILSVGATTITVELEYDAAAVFTNATMNSVRVYNNMFVDLEQNNFCSVIIDIDDTLLIQSASHAHIPGKTYYPIIVMDTIHHFTIGNNIQVRATRKYISTKLDEILELFENKCCKVIGSINRSESVWSNEEVSLIATTLEY